ncbi:uncharacterized protein KY384_009279 [Bacidia gigantensis]|uniref:uncharacterized protein n=1 Tax=Bacidia gigantensis TaxID=2732470 RepID=UPI001D043E63|nr:uncharacterized protein KY384_009279 [Bacidia gigantensis]KAG8525635.1 hypothetical protein KY384_009279 [Bacidia gigantensis]
MLFFKASSLTILAVFSSLTSATRFCQCENPSYDRKFPGIQEVCSGMGPDWCATNCNFWVHNCDYCQFKPAGSGSDADFAKLKSWCGNQQGYDSGNQDYYKGTDVFCYSYRNRVEQGGYTGCRHENNGDWPLPPDQVRDAGVLFRYPFDGVYVRYMCDKLLKKDAPLLVQGFIKDHGDCQWVKNETTSHILECPYRRGFGNRKALRHDFEGACRYYGGQYYDIGKGAALDAVQYTVDDIDGQQPLQSSHLLSPDQESENAEPLDTLGDDPPPHGPGDIDKPDDPNKHKGDTVIRAGGHAVITEEKKVVYEDGEMRITFID